MKKNIIHCDVFNCKYCNCNTECCKLNSISVTSNANHITMCESFKEIK